VLSRKKGFQKIPTDMMLSIKGISVSLAENNSRIEKLENSIKIYGSIAVGVIVALLGFIFKLN
jgi:dCTP deaminase